MEKVRDGYKMTELGEIPEDWEVKRFGEIFSFMKSGLSRKLKEEDVGIPCIRSNNIGQGKIDTDDLKYWFLEDDKGANVNDYILDNGDILVNFINSIAQIGKTCIYSDIGRKSIYTTNIFRIKVNNELVYNKFFYYYAQTTKYNMEISLITKPAVNQASFTSVDFKSIKMPIATMKEQKKISLILSSVDEKIEITDNLIEKTKELKKGLMQKLLTKGIGHDRFKDTEIGRIPEDWEVRCLREIIQICYGKSQKEVEVDDGKYKILGTGGIIGRTNKFLWNEPSVLIGRKGTIDKPQYIEEPFWTVDTLFYTKLKDDFSAKWLFYYLSNIDLKKYNEATGVPSLSVSILNNIKIITPLCEEQKQIASILSSVDEKIEQYESKKEKLKELKKGLMQKLLTGNIRVK